MNIEQARRAIDALAASLPVEAITGTLLHRAWLKSGRPDPLIDADAWDGFALTIQALAKVEGLVGRLPTVCGEAQLAAALVRTPETLDVERLEKALYRAGVSVPRGTSRPAWTRTVAAAAELFAATPSPTPPEGLETLSERAWREALARPSFRAALDEGLADLEAGRTEQWATVRQRLLAASAAPDPGAALREALEDAMVTLDHISDDAEFRVVAIRGLLAPSAEPPETA